MTEGLVTGLVIACRVKSTAVLVKSDWDLTRAEALGLGEAEGQVR